MKQEIGSKVQRRLAVGAEVLPDGGCHFRVWAPRRKSVEILIEADAPHRAALDPEPDGYFSGVVGNAAHGTLYRFRLDGDDSPYADPASRYQPNGPHGSSQVIDPGRFAWSDTGWPGVSLKGQVIYEMHLGTFTQEGTCRAAARELPALADTGVTVIELMPVADFPGRFGWGYDGVALFAPNRLYGEPDDYRHLVDTAHSLGLGVVLDVVYNHFGPDGNSLRQFSEAYFTSRYENEWGEAINFDGEDAGPVREFFLANAEYWVREFHVDGLRLDATQQMFDRSPDHIVAALIRRVRDAASGRATIVVAENEPQQVKLVEPAGRGGYGGDGLWNDDFHHSAMVAMTGRNEAYYTDYLGRPQEMISALKWGYLYQGQRYKWQKKRRGTPALGLDPWAFVLYIQNHDQVANSGRGLRCHELTSPGRYRAMTALMLLAPATPMLFQGQEFAASTPFLYFADQKPELATQVRQGRARFLSQFRSLASPEVQAGLDDPGDPRTFVKSKLDFADRERHAQIYQMHRDLLSLRRADPTFAEQRKGGLDGAVLGTEAFVLRFFGLTGDDRLLLVNFGTDLDLDPAPEPLLAPPAGMRWLVRWSSEDPRYGGGGTSAGDTEDNWRIPGHAAEVLVPALPEAGDDE